MKSNKRNAKRNTVIASCATMFFVMSNFVTTAVLAYIFQSYADVGQSMLLLIMTVTPLVGIVTSFIAGPLSLKVKPKTILITSMVLIIVAGAIFVFGGGVWSYGWMIFAAALSGVVAGMVSTIASSLVTAVADDEREAGKFNGYVNAGMQCGALAMSLFGGLIGSFSWTYAYLLYFLAIPVLLFLIFCLPDEKIEQKTVISKSNWRQALPRRNVAICLLYALLFMAFYTFSVDISEYVVTAYHLGSSFQAGIVSALLTSCGVVAGLFYDRYAHALRRWFMPVMSVLVLVGCGITAFVTGSLAGCIVGAMLVGFSKTAVAPYSIGQIARSVPREMVPVSISFLMGAMNLGMFLSVYVVNGLSLLGTQSVFDKFLISGLIGLLGFVFSWLLFARKGTTAAAGK